MKLLPSPTSARRTMGVSTTGADLPGRGMDAALTLAAFFGIGVVLDRWLGTTPWFMIGLFLLVAVALFVGWKARYTIHMEALEAERKRGATSPTDGMGT